LAGVLLVAVVCVPVLVFAQADTLIVPDEERSEGAVRIKIDESGIRVEGGVTDDTDTTSERRIIFDSRTGTTRSRRYHEKGTDIVQFGKNVRVKADELVRGDIVVFGGDVRIEGKVIGNVVVMAGDADIISGAEINGDVVVVGGMLHEEPEVFIHGERVMWKDLSIPIHQVSRFFETSHPFGFLMVIVKFFVSIVLSFLFVLFLRDRVVRIHEKTKGDTFKAFGAGFLLFIVGTPLVLFVALVLLITIIGIPLALVVVVSWIALFIVARTVFAYTLGVKVSEKLNLQTSNPFAFVFVGMAVIYLPALLGSAISILPAGAPVGALFKAIYWLISVFAYLVGLGALFLSRFGNRGVQATPAAPPATQPE
jgi:hypothetical protein